MAQFLFKFYVITNYYLFYSNGHGILFQNHHNIDEFKLFCFGVVPILVEFIIHSNLWLTGLFTKFMLADIRFFLIIGYITSNRIVYDL